MKIKTILVALFAVISQECFSQIVSDGNGRISIGPRVTDSPLDFTLNGFKQLCWYNDNKSLGINVNLRINLFNEYRVTIGSSSSLQERFYNPIDRQYNIIIAGLVYTNANPPRVEPDDFPLPGEWMNMVKRCQTASIYEKGASGQCIGYALMSEDTLPTDDPVFKVDENGVLFFSTADLLSLVVGAIHEISRQNSDIDDELERISMSVNRIAMSQPIFIGYEQSSKSLRSTVNEYLEQEINLQVSDVNGAFMMQRNLLPGQFDYMVDVSSLSGGYYVVSLSESGEMVTSSRILIK
ncbi:MAG: T9SS type A sorting domain-containing protein [Muribaculum sp.]|nr:T9SS type A sorting domain-containing protein [Muribaculum sp.]